MPMSLHRHVAYAARADGVSMNQFICSVLAAAVGWRSPEQNYSRPPANGDEGVTSMWRGGD